MNSTRPTFSLLLFFTLSYLAVFNTAFSKSEAQFLDETKDEHITMQALLSRVLNQMKTIEYRLDQLAQEIKARSFRNAKDKTQLQEKIAHIRKHFSQKVRSQKLNSLTKSYLRDLITQNRKLIEQLYDVLEQDTPDFVPLEGIRAVSTNTEAYPDVKQLTRALDANDLALANLERITHLSRGQLRRLVVAAEKIGHDINLKKALQRITPYGIIGLWWLFITDEKNVPAPFKPLKRVVGSLPKENPVEQVALVYWLTKINPFRMITTGNKLRENAGILGTPAYLLNNLLKIDKNSLFTLSGSGVGAYVLPKIKADAQAFCDEITTGAKSLVARIKGEPAPEGAIKTPKLTFDSLTGLEHNKNFFGSVVAYLAEIESFERRGQTLPRSYFFVGPNWTGKRSFAQAIAGQTTLALRKAGSSKICSYYEIDATKLLKTEAIDKTVQEAEDHAPCVLAITNVDVLYHQQDKAPYYKLMSKMGEKIRQQSPVLIIAISSHEQTVHKMIDEYRVPSSICYFTLPSFDDRKHFFEKELAIYSSNSANFDYTQLAQETEGAHWRELILSLKTALAKARITQSVLTMALLQESIDQEAHHVMLGATVPAELRHTVAIRCATQALAYHLLQPTKALVRITLLPTTHNPTVYGTVITQSLEANNPADLEKQCIISLATATVDGNVDEQAIDTALNYARRIAFNCLPEAAFSPEEREKRAAQIATIIQRCHNRANDLIKDNQKALGALVTAFEQRITLSAQEIAEIINKINN